MSTSARVLILAVSLAACTTSTGDGGASEPDPSTKSAKAKAEPKSDDAKPGDTKEVICVDMAVTPHASIDLGDAQLAHNGSYALDVEAERKSESCTIVLSNMSPATEQCLASGKGDCTMEGPMTQADSSCELIEISGIQSSGSVRYLDTIGTPKRVSVSVSFDGKQLVSGAVEPAYEPDECGVIEPIVALVGAG